PPRASPVSGRRSRATCTVSPRRGAKTRCERGGGRNRPWARPAPATRAPPSESRRVPRRCGPVQRPGAQNRKSKTRKPRIPQPRPSAQKPLSPAVGEGPAGAVAPRTFFRLLRGFPPTWYADDSARVSAHVRAGVLAPRWFLVQRPGARFVRGEIGQDASLSPVLRWIVCGRAERRLGCRFRRRRDGGPAGGRKAAAPAPRRRAE